MWQDIVFTIGGILGIIALIPSLTSKDKPALPTSVMNFFVIAAFGVADLTLGLHFAAITAVVICSEWMALAWQKHRG